MRIRRLALVSLLLFAIGTTACLAQRASDNAAQSAYSNGWQTGDNGGFGWQPWNLSGSAFLVADSNSNGLLGGPGINTGGRAWGKGTTAGGGAGRNIVGALQVGESITIDLDASFRTSTSRLGLLTTNSGGGVTFLSMTQAGGILHAEPGSVNPISIPLPAYDGGYRYTFTLTSPSTYAANLTQLSTNSTFAWTGSTGGNAVEGIGFIGDGANGNSADQQFVNSMRVTAVPTTSGTYYSIDVDTDQLVRLVVTGSTATATRVGPLGVDVANADLTLHGNHLYMTALVSGRYRCYQIVTSGIFAGTAVYAADLNVNGLPVGVADSISTDGNVLRVGFSPTSSTQSNEVGVLNLLTGAITPEAFIRNQTMALVDADGMGRVGNQLFAVDTIGGANRVAKRLNLTTWQTTDWPVIPPNQFLDDLVQHGAGEILGPAERRFLCALPISNGSSPRLITLDNGFDWRLNGIANTEARCLSILPNPNKPWPTYITIDDGYDWACTVSSTGVVKRFPNPLGPEISNPDLAWFKGIPYAVYFDEVTGVWRFSQLLTGGLLAGRFAGGSPVQLGTTAVSEAEALTADPWNIYVGYGLPGWGGGYGFGEINDSTAQITALSLNRDVDHDGMGWDGVDFFIVDRPAPAHRLWRRSFGGTYSFAGLMGLGDGEINDLEHSYQQFLAGVSGDNAFLFTVIKTTGSYSLINMSGDVFSDSSFFGICRWLPCKGSFGYLDDFLTFP